MIAKRRIMEAEACIIKYFTAASVDRGFFVYISKGIMASIFISKPIQVRSQCELNTTIIVPARIIKIIILRVRGLISMRRIKTNIFGVWAR